MKNAVEVVVPGMSTTLQDPGRAGYAHLGVPTGGAIDAALVGVVNRLVGNRPDATVIETCGGLRIRALTHLLVASSSELAPRSLSPGETCSIPAGAQGRLWHYLAVRGGLQVEPVLGSMSFDTLSRLGPAPCQPGARYGVGAEPDQPIVADVAPLAAVIDTARVEIGPRVDWFEAESLLRLTSSTWTVTASSRVGVRLTGTTLRRTITTELPSEGLVRGAIQVPPDGDPVMMLADHPTTGGYPVIAVVHQDDVAAVAQHTAGATIRFRLQTCS